MKHVCPVCGYTWTTDCDCDYCNCGTEVCDNCWDLSGKNWRDAIIKARKLGIIKEPVNWAKLAEEDA